MPYISPLHRHELDTHIENLAQAIKGLCKEKTDFAGLLNYSCTRLITLVLPELKYWSVALVVGICNNIADEFYRRVGTHYEDTKISENGDVYPRDWTE